jgi:DAACS family dicarboxylate/amino acid:cation (Na+ or H+) symporter
LTQLQLGAPIQSPATSRRLFIATIAALILGAAAGVVFGAATEPLGDVSKLVVQALKAVAVPLLFVAIIDALAKSHMSARGLGWLGVVAAVDAAVAIGIGLLIVHVFQPGRYLGFIKDSLAQGAASVSAPVAPDWHKVFTSLVPESVVEPFVSGSTPAVIVIALAVGLALRQLATRGGPAEQAGAAQVVRLTNTVFNVLITVIGWVVYAVPIAVFCAVAKAVGKSGLAVAGGLGVFIAACLGGMLLQILVTYQGWVLAHPRLTLRRFWRAAKDPVIYAFGINSSLATMPMTLQALEQTEVKEEAARLSACVGTNFNNDGILLYEVVAALILAQAFGLDLSLGEQLYIGLVSVVATLGVAGFPEAGVVALTLVLSAVKIPGEAIVMLMSVDWLIARSRSATNVLGDMAVAVAIDRFLPVKPESAGRGADI